MLIFCHNYSVPDCKWGVSGQKPAKISYMNRKYYYEMYNDLLGAAWELIHWNFLFDTLPWKLIWNPELMSWEGLWRSELPTFLFSCNIFNNICKTVNFFVSPRLLTHFTPGSLSPFPLLCPPPFSPLCCYLWEVVLIWVYLFLAPSFNMPSDLDLFMWCLQ